MHPITVEIKILNELIRDKLPSYATLGSAAVDLCACIEVPITINPGETHLVGSGIAIHLANATMAALILPRSGLGHKHGIVLGNLTGLIDSDYQGELKVSLWNRASTAYTVQPFERIAQMMIVPVYQVNWQVVEQFAESQRGEGGFGSTGR